MTEITSTLHRIQWLSPTGLKWLSYRSWGASDNPHVLLCVHGLTRSSQDFETLARHLSKKVRVVAPDMPGRGQSDWLDDPSQYAIPVYAGACVPLVAALNAQTLDWLGTSMGGLIGMVYASFKGSPIRKLVLNDVGPTLEWDAICRIAQNLEHQVVFPNLDIARAAIKQVSKPFGPHSDEQWQHLCDTVLKPTQSGWTTHYDPNIAAAFQAMNEPALAQSNAMLWATYGLIQANTLVIRGEYSDLLSKATCAAMQTTGPKARVVEVAGVGHAPTFMEASQIQLIDDFLF